MPAVTKLHARGPEPAPEHSEGVRVASIHVRKASLHKSMQRKGLPAYRHPSLPATQISDMIEPQPPQYYSLDELACCERYAVDAQAYLESAGTAPHLGTPPRGYMEHFRPRNRFAPAPPPVILHQQAATATAQGAFQGLSTDALDRVLTCTELMSQWLADFVA